MQIRFLTDKQASDDEDNEIEIVEPKTDTITLDSDNEEDGLSAGAEASSTATTTLATSIVKAAPTSTVNGANALSTPTATVSSSITTSSANAGSAEVVDFMTAAQTFLASMLEVDLTDVQQAPAQASSPAGSSDSTQKKQPRKKTTNKPNPTLLKQKEMLERERLEEMKRNDLKLKMKCEITLKKAEDEYPFAKSMLEEKEAASAKEAEAALQQQLPEQKADNSAEDETNDDEVELLSVVDADSSMEEDKNDECEEKPGEELGTKSIDSQQRAVPVEADRENETADVAEKLEEKTHNDGKKVGSKEVIAGAHTEKPRTVEKAVEVTAGDSKAEMSTEDSEDVIKEKKNVEKEVEDFKVLTSTEETGSDKEVRSASGEESCINGSKVSDAAKTESEAAYVDNNGDEAETAKEGDGKAKCEIVEFMETAEISSAAAEIDNSEDKRKDSSGAVEDVEMLDTTAGARNIDKMVTADNTTTVNAVTEVIRKESTASSHEKVAKETPNDIIVADKMISTASTVGEASAETATKLTVDLKASLETKVIVDAKVTIEPEPAAEPKAIVELVASDAAPTQSDPANAAESFSNPNEPDIDVDKEIEKLLQNKAKDEDECESSTNETATDLFKELSDMKGAAATDTSETDTDAGAVAAASPDLLADINELIENENAMT